MTLSGAGDVLLPSEFCEECWRDVQIVFLIAKRKEPDSVVVVVVVVVRTLPESYAQK